MIAEAHIEPGELVIDIGAGSGALTLACARRGARVIALEIDPEWAVRLRDRVQRANLKGPAVALQRADLVVQAEVATKRAAVPPATLLSTVWAPWWRFARGRFVPATAFRPVPRVDAAVLTIERRMPPLLPLGMAGKYAEFVRGSWPFGMGG